MSNELVNYLVDAPVHTKMEDIKKKVTDMPREKLVERIQATASELVKLQYSMREYSVLEWYESLSDRHKALHDFFETHVGRFKSESKDKYNWVVLSDSDFGSGKFVKVKQRFDDSTDVWFGYITNSKKVEKATKEFSSSKLDGMLFTPLFSTSK